jgi:hypothetical protein
MKRKYNLRKLKAKKSYSSLELATALGVHVQTIHSWKKDGLPSIDNHTQRPLFLGSTVQEYLKGKMDTFKVKLKDNEFYCFKCKKATTSLKTEVIDMNRYIGKQSRSIMIKGECVKCNLKLNRLATQASNKLVTGKVINSGLSPCL